MSKIVGQMFRSSRAITAPGKNTPSKPPKSVLSVLSSFDIRESWSRGCSCYQLLCISHYHSGRERGLVVHNERQSVEVGKEEEDAISSNLGSHPSSSIFCSFAVVLRMTQLTGTRSYGLQDPLHVHLSCDAVSTACHVS